jgi:lipopolysaccharide/colanic/teichoic acid biosynthesis glycosyltransferase
VLGPSHHLLPLIEEFKEHGIGADRVVIAGNSDFLAAEAMTNVIRICNEQEIRMDFVPQLIGLNALQGQPAPIKPESKTSVPISLRRYHGLKRYMDFTLSLLLTILLLPVLLIVAAMVLLDVGSPVFYWQRRTGINAQTFQMHKFRTLKPSFDWRGRPVSTTDRMSAVGMLLRKTRLDELPQLLNVLVGDMAMVGPRPLLPHDQPPNQTLRLMVRPGITGWAQVNGGKQLSPHEKNTLDEWYIRNASPWLDLKILAKTIPYLFAGSNSESRMADMKDFDESPGSAQTDPWPTSGS